MAGQRQRMSAEVPRSHLKHTGARSSNPQVLCAPALAKEAKGSHHGQDHGGPATSASRTIKDGAESPEKQGSNDTDVPVCPKVCTKCCRTLTIADKPTSDVQIARESDLRDVVGGSDDGNGTNRQPESQTNAKEKGTRKPLLEVIRMLAEIDPDERTSLVVLLKAFGG